jgi:hypothetical protein
MSKPAKLSQALADLLKPHQDDAAQATTAVENFPNKFEIAGHHHAAAKGVGAASTALLAAKLVDAGLPLTDRTSEADTVRRVLVGVRDDVVAQSTPTLHSQLPDASFSALRSDDQYADWRIRA